MLPENAPLLGSFLGINVAGEPPLADLVERVRQAAADVAKNWTVRLKGQQLLELRAVRLEREGAESAEVFSFAEIEKALAESRRLVLEAPAGRGKTTTLIQLAQQARAGRTGLLAKAGQSVPEPTPLRVQNMVQRLAGFDPLEKAALYASADPRTSAPSRLRLRPSGGNPSGTTTVASRGSRCCRPTPSTRRSSRGPSAPMRRVPRSCVT